MNLQDPQQFTDLIVETVRSRLSSFLSGYADAEKFLLERAKRWGELAFALITADDPDQERLAKELTIVTQTIENDVARVAVDANVELRKMFKVVLGTTLQVLTKLLPSFL